MRGPGWMAECETWVSAIPKITRTISRSRIRSTTQAAIWLENDTPSLAGDQVGANRLARPAEQDHGGESDAGGA